MQFKQVLKKLVVSPYLNALLKLIRIFPTQVHKNEHYNHMYVISNSTPKQF